MWCGVISLFPAAFNAITQFGITSRAVKTGLLTVEFWDPRDFTTNKHATVDDRPFGGGPGMVMMAIPLRAAIQAAKEKQPTARVIYLSPAGKPFTHTMAREMAQQAQPLVFIAGRYEGIDQRIIEDDVDEQISIGDYVLSGGELAVMVIIDAMTRWLPGALGDDQSAPNDAFSAENGGLLDCPHYTRPAELANSAVPAVLLGGDHKAIATWRRKQALGQTWLHRPELLATMQLDKVDQQLLAEFQAES